MIFYININLKNSKEVSNFFGVLFINAFSYVKKYDIIIFEIDQSY